LALYLEAGAMYQRFSGSGGIADLGVLRYTGGGGVGFLF